MRQVRLLELLRPLGRWGRIETLTLNGLLVGCGFRPSCLNRHNRLSIAGQALPAVLGEVPCV